MSSRRGTLGLPSRLEWRRPQLGGTGPLFARGTNGHPPEAGSVQSKIPRIYHDRGRLFKWVSLGNALSDGGDWGRVESQQNQHQVISRQGVM